MSTMRWVSALLVLVSFGARAQYAADDFSTRACGVRESIFVGGFEPYELDAVRASGGRSQGPTGDLDLAVDVPDTGRVHLVRARIPASYTDASAWPLVIALHGAAGSAAQTPAAAAAVRALWQDVADAEGVIILAPAASGAQGGWVPGLDTPALACALAQVERRYNVDRARRHVWGFSAGGHYTHSLGLANAGRLTAYAVKAGALLALACDAGGGANDCSVTLPLVTRPIAAQLRVGSADPLRPHVDADRGRLLAAGWVAGMNLTHAETAGGHSVVAADIQAAWAWFAPRSWAP